MEQKKVTAIVTRAVPYNETDMILTLVTLEEGRITATAKSCLKPHAKLRYAAEPMNFGEYMLAGRGDRYIVTDCTQIESFGALTADLANYYAAALVLDVLQKLSPESQPSLFMHAVGALKSMAFENVPAPNAIADFLLSALSDNGYDLDLKFCSSCGCILEGDCAFTSSGGIVCRHCADYTSVIIDGVSRAFLSGEHTDIPKALKTKANLELKDIVYELLGVKISSHYFVEYV